MIDFNRNGHPFHNFSVRVGHQRVRVSAPSAAEAIAMARQRLCAEMPRLYDVIRDLDETRFVVEPL